MEFITSTKQVIRDNVDEVKDAILEFFHAFIPKFLWRYVIFIKRPLLMIWVFVGSATFYYYPGASTPSIIIVDIAIFLYFIILNFSLSNTLEKLFRAIENVRRIATNTEKERLLPLFNEVSTTVNKKDVFLKNSVKLYIVDTMSINAFALGRKTIAITRGLMEHMSDEEIKGVFAHEFAHISYGDSQIKMLISFASNMYLWVFIFFSGLLNVIINALDGSEKTSFISSVLSFFRSLLYLSVNITVVVWSAFIAGRSRKREYRADKFAYDLGYGENLLSALYKLYDMQVSDKKSLIERAKAGHPRIAYRIEALENMI